jgi:hypothetical protein
MTRNWLYTKWKTIYTGQSPVTDLRRLINYSRIPRATRANIEYLNRTENLDISRMTTTKMIIPSIQSPLCEEPVAGRNTRRTLRRAIPILRWIITVPETICRQRQPASTSRLTLIRQRRCIPHGPLKCALIQSCLTPLPTPRHRVHLKYQIRTTPRERLLQIHNRKNTRLHTRPTSSHPRDGDLWSCMMRNHGKQRPRRIRNLDIIGGFRWQDKHRLSMSAVGCHVRCRALEVARLRISSSAHGDVPVML